MIKRAITALTVAGALVFSGGIAANAATYLPNANPNVRIVPAFPAIQKTAPAPGKFAVGPYSDGVKKRVYTNKCASGIARQGAYREWIRHAGGWLKGNTYWLAVCER